MPAKAANVAIVTSAKINMPTLEEAQRCVYGLRLVSEDSEAALSVRGEATLLSRELAMNVNNANAREELVKRGHALANRA